MANRNTLHINHLTDFSAWLVADGWKVEEPNGAYEVLRARKGNRFMPIYQKHGAVHFSVADQFEGVMRAFLKFKRKD